LIAGSTDEAQFTKLQEEVEELHASIGKGTSPIDDIGDIMVVLINIAERNGLSLTECLEHAYDEIKFRRGKMLGGVFVKEDTYSEEATP
jgi:NTP pyrophosphatase (non-canonical NTP hydrolase)